ncbi:hypothetical protein BH11ACT1_BH11ACT1_12750 [soil metagenome]
MSEQESTAGSRRRWWLWGTAVAIAVLAAFAITTSGQSTASSSASPSSSTHPTQDETPAPTADAGDPVTTPALTADTGDPGATPAPTPVDTPAEPIETSPPAASITVPIDAEAEIATGVTARIASLEAVTGTAMQPGEVGGPALRATIELVNSTDAPIDLRGAVVNLAYGAGSTPASPIAQPGGEPFAQSVAAGETAKGIYVFTVPSTGRDNVSLDVDVRLGGQITVFEGPAPR